MKHTILSESTNKYPNLRMIYSDGRFRIAEARRANERFSHAGFTIIELLVIIAIIGILSSVLFLSKTSGEKKLALQMSAFQLTQDLREVQGMAMGAAEEDCGTEKTYSFGICFDLTKPTSYLLFADCGPDADQIYNGNDKVLREVNLEKWVEIYDLKVQDTSISTLNIVFSPPDPITYINTFDWATEGTITFSLESNTKQVKINSAGRIEIE